jgi:glyoxylase-like metal-dependent hydrolase (beta-lactamase superfamily II)
MKYKFKKQSIQESLKSRQWLFARLFIIVGIILAGLLVINQFALPEAVPASSDVAKFSSERALDHLKVIAKEPPSEIKAITLHYLIDVNSYLVKTAEGYILIDTGISTKRTDFEKELESAGVKPGNLKLILLTHGDFDHTGNAAYLRKKFGTEIAMHDGDSGMVERGDMFWNRKKSNIILGMMAPILLGFGKSERFKPDLYIEDGYNLSIYGFDAKVLHIPGHSKGSIGILTAGGDLFCGDLLMNEDKPGLNSNMDDSTTANASVEKLKKLSINTVYPGHGKSFPWELFLKNHRTKNTEEN